MEQCKNVGGDDPSPESGDVVCRVNTGGMNFAGLSVQSDAMIGTKLILPAEATPSPSSPEYQLVFIKDRKNVTGPRLLVWIFNKLTGDGNENEDENEGEDREQAVTSLARFYAKISSDDDDESKSVVFTIETSLDIAVKFPSLLLKILPVSKEKAEMEGSASVVKTLVKDTNASLQRIVESYVEMSNLVQS